MLMMDGYTLLRHWKDAGLKQFLRRLYTHTDRDEQLA
jgi:hypothetical protein